VKLFSTKKQIKIKDNLRNVRVATTSSVIKSIKNFMPWEKSTQICEIQINDQFFDLNEHN